MNTVNYNDAEQLFGAVGTSLKKHTAEISDIVNVYGAKNLFNLNDIFTLNRLSISNDVFTNTSTDTRSYIWFYIDAYNSENTKISTLLPSTTIDHTGVFVTTIEIPANTSYLRIGHNGFTNNIDFKVYFNRVGVYKFSINFIAVDVTTVGGFSFNNIMIRLASIEDDTYEPYAKTNQRLTQETTGLIDNNFANGAVNLLPNNATSKIENNVTFVVNNDGSITVSTNSSGASAATQLDIGDSPVGTYHLSGCPSGGSTNTYSLYVGDQYLYETGNGLDIDFTDSRRVMIIIRSGTVITTPITFKPMITVVDMPNSDYAHYVPYAKSNKELTDDISSLAARIKAIEDTNHLTWG